MASTSADPADLLLMGAAVFTSDPLHPWAEAVAVRDGRIVAVGSVDRVLQWSGPGTRQMSLSGRMVIPGFQDAHIHPFSGGLDRTQCELHDLTGTQAYVEAVGAYARAHPDEPWILGGGWTISDFPHGTPHRSLLDDVVPDRPAYLPNRDGHGAWVNSRALEMAGVTRVTADPPDGRIEREDDGTPFGVLHEGAMDLVERLVPPPTEAQLEGAMVEAQSYLHSLGITAWQDAHVDGDSAAAYRALADRGELTARVVGALWWDRDRGLEQVKDLIELRASGTAGRFRATSVKIMQDGIVENSTAGLLGDYLDGAGRPSGRAGLSFVDPALLARAVARLDREGFQVHVHAIGDRAVREALDAFEAAREAGGTGELRHHIAHIQMVHPDDVPRFAALGVAANAQPYWACLEPQMRDLNIPFLGPERSGWQYPFASLLKAGACLAMGSDWPVTTPDPLKEMEVAVTRVPDGGGADPFLPHERITLEEALQAFTAGSAFVNHLDAETGSIEVGKLADLAVLDRNPFEGEPGEIGQTRVLLTLVDGQPVHVAPDSGW